MDENWMTVLVHTAAEGSMTDYLNFALLGVGNGAVFAALAVALVVCYRSSGVVNFATGALALHAAFTFAFLRRGELLIPLPPLPSTVDVGGPVPFALAMVIAILIEGLVGVALWLVVFRPLRRATPVAKAVASLGVASLLTALIAHSVGTSQILVAPIFPTGQTDLPGDLTVPTDRLWLAITIVAIALALAAVYRFTHFGMATRAASETETGALVSGISPERIALANWAISAMVAGTAGILIAPLVPLVPGTYTLFIVPALAAAVLGRFFAFLPAIIGGFAIGMLQSLAVYMQTKFSWFPSSGVAELIPLILILGVLVVRGKPLPTRGALLEQTLARAPRPRRVVIPAMAGSAVALVLLAVLEGSYRSALITTLIMALISLSLVVVTGYCGQISLAQMTFAGAAAFLLSRFTSSWDLPFPIAVLLAATVAAVVGVVIGLPALRIRGLLVGVVTLSLAVTVEALWFRNNDFNGGTDGSPVTGPTLFGLDLQVGLGRGYPRFQFGVLCLVMLVVVALLVARLRTSRLGSAMLAVRANERSAAAAGISVVRIKLIGFGIGAFIAGLGGCLLAYKQSNASYETFSALPSLAVFLTAYLAGITSIAGAMVAGVISAGGIMFILVDRQIELGDWYAHRDRGAADLHGDRQPGRHRRPRPRQDRRQAAGPPRLGRTGRAVDRRTDRRRGARLRRRCALRLAGRRRDGALRRRRRREQRRPSTFHAGRSSGSSDQTVPARPRCSTRSAGSPPPPGKSASVTVTSRPCRRIAGPSSGWAAPSRVSTCTRTSPSKRTSPSDRPTTEQPGATTSPPCSRRSGSPRWRSVRSPNCRRASVSSSRSRERSPGVRTCCCSTSPRPGWTRPRASGWRPNCGRSVTPD